MNFTPTEPQVRAVDFILKNPRSYLAVGMGIGKSASVLSAFCELYDNLEVNAMLVVAPLRVCNLTWPMEVKQWDQFKHLRVANLRTPLGQRAFLAGMASIYLINYESIPLLARLVEKRGGTVPYDMVVFDECFPAGTLVDTPQGPKKIEDIKEGDCIVNLTGEDVVTKTHLNEIKQAAQVTTQSGRRILSSSTHMYFTKRGWVEAGQIKEGDEICTTRSAVRSLRSRVYVEPERRGSRMDSILQQEMLGKSQRAKKQEKALARKDVLRMWEEFPTLQQKRTWEEVLWDILLSEMEVQGAPENLERSPEGTDQSKGENVASIWERNCKSSDSSDSKLTSDAECRVKTTDERSTEGHRASSEHSRRKRQTHTSAATTSLGDAQQMGARDMVLRIHHPDQKIKALAEANGAVQASYALQTRHRVSVPQNMDRGGRVYPSIVESEGCGCEEKRSLEWDRVESVEVYQSTDIRLDKFRQPDGRVCFYDLSIQRHPSYSVLGLMVHNCTKAKNPKAKRIAAFRKQLPPVDRRIAMSGTPAPNSLLDLWAQVRLLDDGERLGHSFEQFKRTYFHATDYMEYNWVANDGAKERIEQKISDITLVLRSKDWLTDVPEPVFEDVEIKMDDALAAQYRKFEQDLIMEIRNAQITAMNAAALVTKLLQFTSGAIYDGDKVAHTLHDLKLDALRKIYKDTKGPVLVAINFKHEQDRIRRLFPEARFFADAKTQQSQIDLLAQWNRREIPMLVVHPKSCGHGLNIQFGSNTIVYTSLPWSRENYEQTIARLVRRGQKEVTTVYRLMCPGTVDDAIATSLENKKDTEQRLLAALMMLESAKELKLNVPEI